MYRCRIAERRDYDVICTFPQTPEELYFMMPSGTFPLTAAQLEEKAANRHCRTVVTDENDEVVGYANVYGYEEGKQAHLGNVIIAPSHRGTGAAALLIESMIDQARTELRVPQLLLVCHHTNPRAMLFYNKLGFRPQSLKKMANGDEIIVGITMGLDL